MGRSSCRWYGLPAVLIEEAATPGRDRRFSLRRSGWRAHPCLMAVLRLIGTFAAAGALSLSRGDHYAPTDQPSGFRGFARPGRHLEHGFGPGLCDWHAGRTPRVVQIGAATCRPIG